MIIDSRITRVLRIAQMAGTAVLVASAGPLGELKGTAVWWVAFAAWVTLMAELVLRVALGGLRAVRGKRGGQPRGVPVDVPVTGRWKAVNSPADKVPSHGTHFLAQTYAIDIVREPEGGDKPALRWWPPFPRNEDYPAYGSAILAPGDGRVVRVVDSRRDHRARNTVPGLLWFFTVEQIARLFGGRADIVGNHVVLELGDGAEAGTYALFAHLRRGSIEVREGDAVRNGQRIAACGNTGNSTEPHLHFQLMDGPDPGRARGVPFEWRGVGVPKGGTRFAAETAVS